MGNNVEDQKLLDNLLKNFDLLKLLSQTKARYRNSIIKSADISLINAIQDSVFNALKGNIKYSKKELERLKRFNMSSFFVHLILFNLFKGSIAFCAFSATIFHKLICI